MQPLGGDALCLSFACHQPQLRFWVKNGYLRAGPSKKYLSPVLARPGVVVLRSALIQSTVAMGVKRISKCLSLLHLPCRIPAPLMDLPRIQSLLGIAFFPTLLWLFSKHRRAFPWRLAAWTLSLQLLAAWFLLRTAPGHVWFLACDGLADQLSTVAMEGAKIVFGPLADGVRLEKAFGEGHGHVFAVWVGAVITVVSACVALLNHWNVLPKVVSFMASLLRRTLGYSGSESLCATANGFLGHTESILVIKAYVEKLTSSELLSTMTMGLATVSLGAIAVYAKLGDGAGHLVTATFLSILGGLFCSKILLPETELSHTRAGASLGPSRTAGTAIEAVCAGAQQGLMLALSVLAMLLAFTALVAIANITLGGAQSALGVAQPWKLEQILGLVHAPVAWLTGVASQDCLSVGDLLGRRTVFNEFLGYLALGDLRGSLSPRSFTLATYALSGFANPASIGMLVAAIASIAPGRMREAAELGTRALLAGLCTSYLSASIAGFVLG